MQWGSCHSDISVTVSGVNDFSTDGVVVQCRETDRGCETKLTCSNCEFEAGAQVYF